MYNSVTNQIHICENITDFKEFARKLIHSMNMSQKDIETGIANELWVIKKIYANDKHLNLISILEIWMTSYWSTIFLRYEIMRHEFREFYLRKLYKQFRQEIFWFNEKSRVIRMFKIVEYIHHIISNLEYIHDFQEIYRDLKSQNCNFD